MVQAGAGSHPETMSRTRGAAAGGWRNSRQSGSSFSGKVVFLIMLLIVILTGVLGFLGES